MNSFAEIVGYRRSVRKFDRKFNFDHQVVRKSIELATLAPNSSNMQLWEFHNVVSTEMLEAVRGCCLGQNPALTANEFVIFVTSYGKWEKRAIMNAEMIRDAFKHKSNVPQHVFDYYEKDMPRLYGGKGLVEYKGLTGDAANQIRSQDVRVIMHKSLALAAMTFMYAMAEAGYDTCPMEGFEEDKVKRVLQLPDESEVSIVVACGKRLPEGVYGERKRVDLSDVLIEH